MNPKTTAVLFVLAAALASFVYFWEIRGEQARVEAKAAEERLFPDVDQGDIAAISLRTGDAPEIRLERHEGRWRIAKPIDVAADTFAADGIASAITQLHRESESDDPRPPDVYGFGADAAEVRFSVGGFEKQLEIGAGTPVGSNSYVMVEGDPKVYTVASYQLASFKKKLDDLRDRRILEFDEAKVQRLTVSWPEARVVLERTDAGWRMTEPVDSPADADTIDGLLSSLSFLRAADFVDAPGSDAEMGFDPPQFAVELALSGDAAGSAPQTLGFAVGGVNEGGQQRFARRAPDAVYLISQESLDGFPRRVVDYRDRRLAAFKVDDVRRVDLGFHTKGGEAVEIEVRRDDGHWKSDAGPVKADAFDALVDSLSDLRAHDIVAEEFGPDELAAMGLDPAKVVVQVYGGGDPAERLAEVQLGVAFGDGMTARTPDRETIFLIDKALSASFPADPDDFQARFIAPPESAAPESTGAGAEAAAGGAAESD